MHLLSLVTEFLIQYYETLILEAKCKRESTVAEAVEKAVTSELQDIHSKLDKCFREKKAVADVSLESFILLMLKLHMSLLSSFFPCFFYLVNIFVSDTLYKNTFVWRRKIKNLRKSKKTHGQRSRKRKKGIFHVYYHISPLNIFFPSKLVEAFPVNKSGCN